MFLIPRTPRARLRRAAGALALVLVTVSATLSPTSAASPHAASAYTDPCSYLTDAAASVALSVENVHHARVSNDLCVYRVPRRLGSLAFVDVVTSKGSALASFAQFLRLAGDRSQPIAGLGDVAYAIGPNVVALRDDTLIVTGIREAGDSRSALRTASIELARGAANSRMAINSTCGEDSARVREAAH